MKQEIELVVNSSYPLIRREHNKRIQWEFWYDGTLHVFDRRDTALDFYREKVCV